MAAENPVLVWLRRDLRLADNPALDAASKTGRPVIPAFIRTRPKKGDLYGRLGGASAWWRGQSLAALRSSLRTIGSDLILRTGAALDVLRGLADVTGADTLIFNRSLEPAQIRVDATVISALRDHDIEVIECAANRLHEPWTVKTTTGGSFKVFTPFWRRLAEEYRPPVAHLAPAKLAAPKQWPESEALEDWQVKAAWSKSLAEAWAPSESAARKRLTAFSKQVEAYPDSRDRPDWDGTSRFSPYLAWGEISVHEIWRRLSEKHGTAADPFLRQLGWRDFNSHLLYHFADLPHRPWTAKFERLPFETDSKGLKAWQRGLTGYPIVDAGMRQLWATGWMHNRVRMIVASFLIKDQRIDWREGEAWFWDTLVDADLAQNAGNWQWVAGSGADAAPYFRIFNPVSQSRKFDPDGDYIRR
jgi:deoxyribodipyrimidine photo-lyase